MKALNTVEQNDVGSKYSTPEDQKAKGDIAKLAEGFAGGMADGHFVGVPHAGHVPHLEKPGLSTQAVLEFLG